MAGVHSGQKVEAETGGKSSGSREGADAALLGMLGVGRERNVV